MAEKPKSEKWKGARTRNLTAAQQKQAKRIVGGGRSEKVTAAERKAAQAKVDIGQTKWVTAKDRGGAGRGGLLTDTSGKAVTGTVTLPSGKTATYVRGKRIGVVAAAGGGGGTGRGGGGGGGDGAGRKRTAAEKAAMYKGKGRSAMEQARATQARKVTEAARKRRRAAETARLTGQAAAYKKGKGTPTKRMKPPINWGRTVTW